MPVTSLLWLYPIYNTFDTPTQSDITTYIYLQKKYGSVIHVYLPWQMTNDSSIFLNSNSVFLNENYLVLACTHTTVSPTATFKISFYTWYPHTQRAFCITALAICMCATFRKQKFRLGSKLSWSQPSAKNRISKFSPWNTCVYFSHENFPVYGIHVLTHYWS